MLPRNERLHNVVGEPLSPLARGVTVEQHHAQYFECVRKLYRKHAKECYCSKQPKLEVW